MTNHRHPFLALALAASCGSDGGPGGAHVLDCAWAASADNCWLALLDEVAVCAVPDGETGVFDATRTRCTYASGWVIDFAEPVPIGGSSRWNFTVSRDGVPCVRYTDVAEAQGTLDLEVETGGNLVTAVGTLGVDYTLTCPDGERYVTTDPQAVLTCGDPRGYKIPGVTTIQSSGSSVGLSIPLGEEPGGADIDVPLFDCTGP